MNDEAMLDALDAAGDPYDEWPMTTAFEEGFEAGWRAREAQPPPPEDSSLHIVWAGAVMDERERGERLAEALRAYIVAMPSNYMIEEEDAARAALAEWDAATVTEEVKPPA